MDAVGNFVITWNVVAVIGGSPDGDGDGVLAQRFNSQGSAVGSEFLANTTTIYSASTTDALITIDESLTLAAGTYEFSLRANLSGFVYPYNGAASYNGVLAVVPAPSSLALLALSAPLATRRRR